MPAEAAPEPSSSASPAGRQRLRVAQSGLAMAVLLLIQILLLAEVAWGTAALNPVRWFVVCSMAGALTLFGLVHTGWSERLSREPSLSLPQMVYAQACTVWAYALAGPARGALLCLMPLILSYGVFALNGRTVQRLTALGIAMLGAGVAGLAWWDPAAHPWRLELAHWVFSAVAMASVSVLGRRLGRMRQRLRRQKADLSEALMHIQALAMRDSLTGLLNRRAMLDELRAEARRAERSGQAMSLALVDMDHFKAINDSQSHGVGDRVLQRFAEVARQEMRDTDRLARWGGEEFLLLLPQATQVQAAATLERIRLRLVQQPVEGASPDLVVTFSAGVARCTRDADVEAVVDLADMAMYRAKTGGRNRTECAQAPRDLAESG
jgi:diguanylate cyclase (GGDEF)-like protein